MTTNREIADKFIEYGMSEEYDKYLMRLLNKDLTILETAPSFGPVKKYIPTRFGERMEKDLTLSQVIILLDAMVARIHSTRIFADNMAERGVTKETINKVITDFEMDNR